VLSADLKGAQATPVPLRRLSAPFDALREAADAFGRKTGHPPKVFLASLGNLATHSARSTWAKNFLAAGGIEAIASDGFTDAGQAAKAFAGSGTTVGCIASSDQVYADQAESAAKALKAAGAACVLLAGRAGDSEAALRTAGIDRFIYAGCDMVEALGGLQSVLGVNANR
jgi:methylmalonyl-CoA mutase